MYADVLRQVESVVDADPTSGLLPRIADGDRGAMELFYRQFQEHVFRFALAGLRDPIAAADVLHAVMLNVWVHAREYPGGDLMVWLLAFACRDVVSRLPQRQRDFTAAVRGDSTAGPETVSLRTTDRADDAGRVRAALAELPPAQRLALHLAFGEDMPYEDVADVLDCAESVAAQLIHEGQRCLKQRVMPGADVTRHPASRSADVPITGR